MNEQARFQEIVAEALAKLEAMGLYGVVMASVSGLDRPGYCSGEVSERIGPAAKVVHLGFIHVSAYEEMEGLHPDAVLEAAKESGHA